MKIRAKLRWTAVCLIVITLVVGLVLFFMARQIDRSLEEGESARQIVKGTFELNLITYDYLLHPGERTLRQWELKHNSLSKVISNARFDDEKVSIQKRISENDEVIKDLFNQMVTKDERGNLPGAQSIPYREARDSIAAQLVAKTQMMLSDASFLRNKSDLEIAQTKQHASFYVIISFLAMIIIVASTSLLLSRSIGRSLRKLEKGAQIIAAGNLNYRVNIGTKDEIGNLAEAFNEMTSRLSTSYASIDDLKRTEEALRESEQRWATTLASVGDAVIATDVEGKITFMNDTAEELTGWPFSEASAKPVADIFHIINEHARNRVQDPVAKVLKEGVIVGLANHTILVRKDGTEVPIDDSGAPIRDSEGKTMGVVLVFHDITERKRANQERETTVEFLRLVNESTTTRGLIQRAVVFFQGQSGCEAVGVRLREGDDYPYFEVHGFPQEFVLLENQLCARDSTGEVVRDGAGDPVIECMCGNIIRGRFDPSKPFFSAGGSFWTNSTTELLASTTEVDRQSRTRNRCNGEGYESVALLPLQAGEGRIGLLQLNDRRRGKFTPEIIALWERLAGYLATALAKFRAEEALQDRTLELQHLTETLEERVKQRTSELATLSSELLVAQEKERRRVSQDLHDYVWQTLEVVKFDIENLFSGQENWTAFHEKSKRIISAIRDAVAKIRSMQGDLWPSVLDDIGVLATIDWYCREFDKNNSGLNIEKHLAMTEDEVPSSAKIVIYRVMQEAMNNIAKHSEAKRVSLSLIKSDHRVEFTVEDDGIGFDPEEAIIKRSPWGGLGLLSMKERTELSGGLFRVESSKGKGTTVRASWPFHEND